MVSQLKLKRTWCGIGVMSATVMLAIGLIVQNTRANSDSEGKFPGPLNARCVSCSSNAQRTEHPKPWLKIVVNHMITVATRLVA
jgi:hypothetical protein